MSPRKCRYELSDHTYFHVCVRGNGGQPVFRDDKDRETYIDLVDRHANIYELRVLAYCLMGNHIHLLFVVPSILELSKAMHRLNTSYAMYFNHRYKVGGHLFQSRFSSWVIRDDEHLTSTIEYIENNPVKSGLAIQKEEYRWSSARRDSPGTVPVA